jgi:hypothetical protein
VNIALYLRNGELYNIKPMEMSPKPPEQAHYLSAIDKREDVYPVFSKDIHPVEISDAQYREICAYQHVYRRVQLGIVYRFVGEQLERLIEIDEMAEDCNRKWMEHTGQSMGVNYRDPVEAPNHPTTDKVYGVDDLDDYFKDTELAEAFDKEVSRIRNEYDDIQNTRIEIETSIKNVLRPFVNRWFSYKALQFGLFLDDTGVRIIKVRKEDTNE